VPPRKPCAQIFAQGLDKTEHRTGVLILPLRPAELPDKLLEI
jgi:hypothetical protein